MSISKPRTWYTALALLGFSVLLLVTPCTTYSNVGISGAVPTTRLSHNVGVGINAPRKAERERVSSDAEQKCNETRTPASDDSKDNTENRVQSGESESELEADCDTCCLCCEKTKHWAVGACGHRVACAVCSLRMRGLLNSTECVTCKQAQPFLVVSVTPDQHRALHTCTWFLSSHWAPSHLHLQYNTS